MGYTEDDTARVADSREGGRSGWGAPLRAWSETGLQWLVLASLVVFILWPIAAVLRVGLTIDGSPTLELIYEALTDSRGLLWNSIFVGVLATTLTLFIAVNIAFWATRSGSRLSKPLFGLLLLTMISPPFVTSLSYVMLFGRRGLITHQLLGLRLDPYGWHGVVLMQGIGFTSLAAILLIGVLRGIDGRLEEASLDLGASRTSTIARVTLPLLIPGIAATSLITFVESLADFGTPIIIGGRFTVLATQAYLNFIGISNLPVAAGMAILLLIPSLIAFLLYRHFMGRLTFYTRGTSVTGDPMGLPRWLLVVTGAVTLAFSAFVTLQYVTILFGAFATTWGVDFTPTLRHIQGLPSTAFASLGRSIRFAMFTAVVGSMLGMVVAYLLERRRFWGRSGLDFIATLPFMIPGPFLGIGYALAFRDAPLALTGTLAIVLLNMIYRQLPVATKAGAAVLSQADPEVEDAARDLGASESRIIKDVVFPQLKPAFLVGFVNTFTASMVTIGAIIFLITPGTKVATIELFGAVRGGHIGVAAVLANIIMLVTLTVNVTFSWLLLRRSREERGVFDVPATRAIDQVVQRADGGR